MDSGAEFMLFVFWWSWVFSFSMVRFGITEIKCLNSLEMKVIGSSDFSVLTYVHCCCRIAMHYLKACFICKSLAHNYV